MCISVASPKRMEFRKIPQIDIKVRNLSPSPEAELLIGSKNNFKVHIISLTIHKAPK